eukprot:CAMPEP_0179105800 /NCGR_PEP_ID=MMETSP0796-20121207/49153_1 /TAXON_ID=73915 /ORGANISM="Pyrodinium bahamense, Strain pbaha01" /LENGTH=114 /DNA_ID=CAMNT_0020803795 /DNA_START=102 /DNA_END=444 /DNA_ORIENTATION=-
MQEQKGRASEASRAASEELFGQRVQGHGHDRAVPQPAHYGIGRAVHGVKQEACLTADLLPMDLPRDVQEITVLDLAKRLRKLWGDVEDHLAQVMREDGADEHCRHCNGESVHEE